MDLVWFGLRFWSHFRFDFRILCTCVKTTTIDDRTMVLLDFPKSGASDFNDFCTVSGIIFNIPFLIDFLQIFDRFLTSFWHLNRSASDKKPPEAFKKTFGKQLKKKHEKKSRNRCKPRGPWTLGPLKT